MNKVTTTLAGLAVLATAGIAPAFAQTNNFSNDGAFTFAYSPTTFSINNIAATYNPVVGMSTSGFLSLTGGTSTDGITFMGATLSFTPTGGGTLTETPVDAAVNVFPGGVYDISGFVPATVFASSYTFNLQPGSTSPVPETSTVVSFGVLLALGGLAVLRRKSTVKNAA